MYLVLDIGGTFIKYALMNSGGNIIDKGRIPSPNKGALINLTISDTERQLERFKEVLFSIIDRQDLTSIKGIAISCPGTIDVETGIIYNGGDLYPFLHEVNVVEILEERYGKVVHIENDGKCAALAELWLGSVKDVNDSVVLVLGSGVGGGIILNKKLHRGVHLSAGEVSYVMSGLDAITKEAQFVGLEYSAVEMVKRIAQIKKIEDPTDGEAVYKYINQQDREAMEVFDDYCTKVASLVLNMQYILDPEIIAIGGGISAQPILVERIQWVIDEIKKKNPLHVASPKVVACQFQNDANLYGALFHFFVNQEKK
ncbi:ROK family protein [Alkalihalobacillus sp. 1P02AB]|uniref:ROK family protein n=1 Tax=Alkalihalobacillus sp. 1P02AB TaxID=3132260 RepID=UPI0039A4DA5B